MRPTKWIHSEKIRLPPNPTPQPLSVFKLCESILPVVPENFKGKDSAESAGLQGPATEPKKKSREACEIRNRVREAVINQKHAALEICTFESQTGMKAAGGNTN